MSGNRAHDESGGHATFFSKTYIHLMKYDDGLSEHYNKFKSQQSSLTALVFLTGAVTIGFCAASAESLPWNPLSLPGCIRLIRVLSVLPLWVFSFREYLRQHKQKELEQTGAESELENNKTNNGCSVPVEVWWANQSILWISISGALLLLHRSIVGECLEDMRLSTCNPRVHEGGIPADTMITTILGCLLLPMIVKSHDMVYSFAGFIIIGASFVASLIIAEANRDVTTVIACLSSVGFCLYDYEKSTFNIFLSCRNAEESHAEALRTARIDKSTEEEENEQLSLIMGNVAHDLKTPFQSLVADIDGLKVVLNALFKEIKVDSRSSVIYKCQSELDGIITGLENGYSSAILAINRSEDFRMATAGIPLVPRGDAFNVDDCMRAAISCMEEGPSVALRILSIPGPVCSTLATATAKAKTTLISMCPMMIGDKQWFLENILSLVSNALKFTVNGSVEVEYCLAASTNTERLLPVVVDGLSVKDLFVAAERDQCDLSPPPPEANIICGNAVSLPYINIPGISGTATMSSLSSGDVARDGRYLKSPSQSSLYLLVLVHDTGIGVPSEARTFIFKDFYRRQMQRGSGTGGTGLGLFTLSKRMEALGGHCGVQDREDGHPGSSFWLAYPYKPDWSAADALASEVSSGNINRHAHRIKSRSQASNSLASLPLVGTPRTLSYASTPTSAHLKDMTHEKEFRSLSVLLQQMLTETMLTEQLQLHQIGTEIESSLRSRPISALATAYPLRDPFWRSVLIVEDSPVILKSLSRLFVREGFDVDIAQNGAIGLEKMTTKKYVLVLSDLQMPVMDGHEMTRRIRAQEAAASCLNHTIIGTVVPANTEEDEKESITDPPPSIIVDNHRSHRQLLVGMSANCTSEVEKDAKESGMDYFLSKPVIKEVVSKCLLAAYAKEGVGVRCMNY